MTENNKVIYDGQTLIDLTQDDVTASDVRSGVYFHDSAGVRGQGTLNIPSMTLLWTNQSPDASFTAQDVSLPNVYNNYDFLEVEYKIGASEDTATGEKIMDRVPCKNWTRAMTVVYGSGVWVIIHRARWWTNNGLHFDSAYWNTLDSYASTGQDDSNMIPYKIYGIKGEIT